MLDITLPMSHPSGDKLHMQTRFAMSECVHRVFLQSQSWNSLPNSAL